MKPTKPAAGGSKEMQHSNIRPTAARVIRASEVEPSEWSQEGCTLCTMQLSLSSRTCQQRTVRTWSQP